VRNQPVGAVWHRGTGDTTGEVPLKWRRGLWSSISFHVNHHLQIIPHGKPCLAGGGVEWEGRCMLCNPVTAKHGYEGHLCFF
jgi:hypothetical protein